MGGYREDLLGGYGTSILSGYVEDLVCACGNAIIYFISDNNL